MVFFKHNKNLTGHNARAHRLLEILYRLPNPTGVFLSTALIFRLLTPVWAEAEPNDNRLTGPQTTSQQNTLVFDDAVQARLGIKTLILKSADFQTEILAYGQVINIQPLLALHSQIRATEVEENIAAAKFKLAEQAIKRQQDLYHNEVASKRSLELQQSTWQTDKNLWLSAQIQHQAAYQQARLNWGDVLTGWLNRNHSATMEQLLSGRLKLLQINLQPNNHLSGDVQYIQADPAGIREQSKQAVLISAAPLAASGSQGESYFFQSRDERLLPGMRVTAWINSGIEESGVIIPDSALVWHLDQAWVYLKNGGNRFEHRIISRFTPAPGGYFVTGNIIKPGESVVVEGAQQLLSAEHNLAQPQDDD